MLQTHHRIGEFEIIRLLGQGGMGEVYEAQQDRPRRRVALKILALHLAQDQQFLGRFWREAEVVAQLDHPGIVRIISTGQSEGIAYYTMHLVQGVSLDGMIRETRDLNTGTATVLELERNTPSIGAAQSPAAEEVQVNALEQPPSFLLSYKEDRYRTVARIGVMVAKALSHAHEKGCIHRDLKPANIMVDQHNQAYLLDFGLTRAQEGDGVTSQPGCVMGTPWYMSPEQARGDKIDHRSDIYSLGVTLYELATQGAGPYAANRKEASSVLTQVRAGEYLPPHSHAPDIPPALERIILKAMNYRPSRRYNDAAEVALDLEHYLEHESGSPRRRGPAIRWNKQRSLLAGALVLLVLAAFAAAFVASPSDPTKKARPEDKKIEWPDDYPAELRNRPWKVPQALMTVEHKPLWERRLAGSGKYLRADFQLMLTSWPKDENPTLIALDDDPAHRWFEFTVDVNAPRAKPDENRVGVFFGWRPEMPRFFIVEIDEHPVGTFAFGVARIGVMRLIESSPTEMAVNDIHWLPGEEGRIPLNKAPDWHRLTVRVVDDRIAIAVDGAQSVPFTLDWLALNRRDLATAVNPRGAVGIWSWHGSFGCFRNAQITAIPSEGKQKER